jgi:phosphoglucosamine mutase
VDVLLVGPMPTPGVAYLTRALRLSAGIVISASHNPFDDNGIKFFSGDGTKLPDRTELAIEAELARPLQSRKSSGLGKARRVDDAAGRYIEFCKSTFPSRLDLHGMRIVVDSANGASYHVAEHVFHELGADVVSIANTPDGTNINHECGATSPAALCKAVARQRADLGIALDGDGDRLIMVDAKGEIYDGDQLLYVIAADRQRQRRLRGGVVGTLMTNFGLEQAFVKKRIPFARAAVGDRYVLEQLNKRGWQLGGENSGHIVCLDQHSTGDGIVSALQVLAALRSADTTLPKAVAGLHMYPQLLVNVRVRERFDFAADQGVRRALKAAESALKGDGRVLLRASGTEPLIRVMVEGRSQKTVARWASHIAEAVRKAAK